MKRKTKVTMNDIARAAGVSQATVSLVLNQSRNIKLSDDTRQRVINVATELGYDRLPAVHAPRNQEEIALLVSSMQSFDPFIDAISQAREAAWRNETLLTVYDYGDDIELALNIIRQLEKRNCIGIILASPVTTLVDMTAFQDCTRIPLVLLNQRDPGSPLLPSFIPDDYANAFQVTKHLIACGATRIAHIIARQKGNIIRLEHNQFVSINRNMAVELKVTLEAFGHEHKDAIMQALAEKGYRARVVDPTAVYD